MNDFYKNEYLLMRCIYKDCYFCQSPNTLTFYGIMLFFVSIQFLLNTIYIISQNKNYKKTVL